MCVCVLHKTNQLCGLIKYTGTILFIVYKEEGMKIGERDLELTGTYMFAIKRGRWISCRRTRTEGWRKGLRT